MSVVKLTHNAFSDGLELVKVSLGIHERTHRLLFKPAHWNAIVREGLHRAGSHWIWQHLPDRFGPKAYELGYPQDAGQTRSPLIRAMSSGLVDRLAQQFWHGYNPWRRTSYQIPATLWRQWIEEERRAGRFEKSRSGYFRSAKRALRQHVKKDLRRRVEELSTSEEINEKIPLVLTGDMRAAALAGARAEPRATSTRAAVRIVIPQSHPTVGWVSGVMRAVTNDELREMAEVVHATIGGRLASDSVVSTPNGGRALTPAARADLARYVPRRPAPRHRSRSVA